MFTARYELSPYINQTGFVFIGLKYICFLFPVVSFVLPDKQMTVCQQIRR